MFIVHQILSCRLIVLILLPPMFFMIGMLVGVRLRCPIWFGIVLDIKGLHILIVNIIQVIIGIIILEQLRSIILHFLGIRRII